MAGPDPPVSVRWPLGTPATPCAGLDPTVEELNAITNLAEALAWAGIGERRRDALYERTGEIRLLRELAFIDRGAWDDAVSHVTDTSPVETGRFESLRRVARLRVGIVNRARIFVQ